eukprot:423526_1
MSEMIKYTDYVQGQLISWNDKEDYQKGYKRVFDAVYSIAPKVRSINTVHKVVICNYNKVDAVERVLSKYLPYNEVKKLTYVLRMAKIKISMHKKIFYQENINDNWGGCSKCVAGFIGMKKLNDNEVAIGVSIYSEKWKEEDFVRINKSSNAWSSSNIEKFLIYQLDKQLNQKKYDKCIRL